MKADPGGNGIAKLWVDDVLEANYSGSLGHSELAQTMEIKFGMYRWKNYPSSAGSDVIYYDEVRYGTTKADVDPPAPGGGGGITGNKRLRNSGTGGNYFLRAVWNNGYTNGSNVVVNDWQNWNSQKWTISDLGGNVLRIKLNTPSGDYNLRAAYNNGYTNGTNVELWQWNNWASQKWVHESLGGGLSRLRVNTGLGNYYLRANSSTGLSNGTNVVVWQWNNWASQKWTIENY